MHDVCEEIMNHFAVKIVHFQFSFEKCSNFMINTSKFSIWQSLGLNLIFSSNYCCKTRCCYRKRFFFSKRITLKNYYSRHLELIVSNIRTVTLNIACGVGQIGLCKAEYGKKFQPIVSGRYLPRVTKAGWSGLISN